MKLLTLLMMMLTAAPLAWAEEIPVKPNPIVGKWRWAGRAMVVEFTDDGRAKGKNLKGKWQEVKTPTLERKYSISWNSGAIVDDLTMDKDGSKMRGRNSQGVKFTSEKLPAEKTAASESWIGVEN